MRNAQQSNAADSMSRLHPQDAGFRTQMQSLNEKATLLSTLIGEKVKEKANGVRYYNKSLVLRDDGAYKPDRSSINYTGYQCYRLSKNKPFRTFVILLLYESE